MTGPVLRAEGLRKSFRRGAEVIRALRGVDLSLRSGEIVAVLGRSGSGKTTLLSLLSGWETADEGRVAWSFDDPVTEPVLPPWRRLAILPQSFGLVVELSVRNNVELPLRLAGRLGLRRRVDEILTQLGLEELADRYPSETSVGQQQRTGVARALILQPAVVLLDEPTGHQDEEWASRMFESLAAISAAGTAVLVATHSEDVARRANRVLTMHDGKLHPTNAA